MSAATALTSQLSALKAKMTSPETAAALTGKPNSAKLIIEDLREVKTTAPVNSAAAGTGSALSSLTQTVKATASEVLTAGAASAGAVASSLTTRIFSVQFNPSSFDIYATSLEVSKFDTVRGEDGKQREYVESAVAPTVEMSVELIFDHVTIADAFMVDKLRQGVVTTAVTAASAIANKGAKVNTVRTEVEGLIGALRNAHTRNITFTWADFSFKGILKDVAAEYTMFSVEGRPIRARVMLRIQQEQKEAVKESWKNDFKAAFGASAVSSAASKLRSATNLINIGL